MTTWSDLRAQLLAELAAAKLAAKQMSKGDESINFRSAAEIQELLDIIDSEDSTSTEAFTTLANKVRLDP